MKCNASTRFLRLPMAKCGTRNLRKGMSLRVGVENLRSIFHDQGENGTGLGLPQVCAFMRRIGGHVGVTSEPGIGTTFELLFPAVQRDDIAEVHPDASERRGTKSMTHQPADSKPLSQRQSEMRYPRAADAHGETVEAMPVDNNLWRQIDRWVNEGDAVGAGTAPSAKV